jgi:hypothetical protein
MTAMSRHNDVSSPTQRLGALAARAPFTASFAASCLALAAGCSGDAGTGSLTALLEAWTASRRGRGPRTSATAGP